MTHPQRLSLILTLCFLAQPAVAGEVQFSAGQGNWTSTECLKPAVPAIDRSDTDRLNRSIERANDYIAQVEAYTRCLKEEAEADMAGVNAVISDETVRLQQEAVRSAEELRDRLTRPQG